MLWLFDLKKVKLCGRSANFCNVFFGWRRWEKDALPWSPPLATMITWCAPRLLQQVATSSTARLHLTTLMAYRIVASAMLPYEEVRAGGGGNEYVFVCMARGEKYKQNLLPHFLCSVFLKLIWNWKLFPDLRAIASFNSSPPTQHKSFRMRGWNRCLLKTTILNCGAA